MSWSTKTKGPLGEVIPATMDAINKSAEYDGTLAGKAAGVSGATAELIGTAAADCPDGKHVVVSTYGHLDHNGLSDYHLNVKFEDPEPGAAE